MIAYARTGVPRYSSQLQLEGDLKEKRARTADAIVRTCDAALVSAVFDESNGA